MTKFLFVLALCTLFHVSQAQLKSVDEKAIAIPEHNCASIDELSSYINQNFTSDTSRVRAIYVWVTHHISYDVSRVLERDKNTNLPPQTAEDALATRKAACQGYVALFTTLCKKAGINAVMVSGYTKNQDKISPLSHAWGAAEFGGGWYLFDPTWGSGIVKDNQFEKKFDNAFYMVSPAKFISNHMPFDPMYQFLSRPLTPKEFTNGTQSSNKVVFQYSDTLKQFNQLTSIQQKEAELRRLEAGGIQNNLLQERQIYLKKQLQSYASKDAFDEGNTAYKQSVALFNEYIGHKNRQFNTINDNDLQQMVDSIQQYLILARSLLLETVPQTEVQRQALTGNLSGIDRFQLRLNDEKQFVKKYFDTDKAIRRQLFMKKLG